MPRRAASKTKVARLKGDLRERLYERAVALYHEEHQKPPPHKPMGLRKVCDEISRAHNKESKTKVQLNHNTLRNLLSGGVTIQKFNRSKSRLTPEEEELILCLLEMADCGHPCSYPRLRELTNEIIRARLGNEFPEEGVGKEWPYRFVERNSKRLHRYKARALDDVRSRAVNKTATDDWFDKVEDLQLQGDDGKPIAPDCTFAMDEAGFQPNGNEGCEFVIGAPGKKLQYQQRAGDRNNHTVLLTIAANGVALRPVIVFPGSALLERWLQDNPAKASLAYSKKGWTDQGLSLEYVKGLDRQTRDIAAGRARSLYVDGHNSHLSFEVLNYCRLAKIKVACYIPHGTHVYQGPDVVIFSLLKQDFGKRRDALLRETGQHITKENFLTVYGQSHLHVLTPELIKEAFRKTGIVPVDRSVVTEAMLAPSKDSSTKFVSPVVPPTPVRVVSDFLIDALQQPRSDSLHEAVTPTECPSTPTHPSGPTAIDYRTRTTMEELKETTARYLFTDSPIKSSAEPPGMPAELITAPKVRGNASNEDLITRLLKRPTKTVFEWKLQEALKERDAEVKYWKTKTIHLQSALVLQRVYCGHVRVQLKAKEEKSKKKSGRKLKGAGLGRIVTADDYFEEVKAQRKARKAERRSARARQAAQEELGDALKKWDVEEERRKGENEDRKAAFERAKVEWKAEKDQARAGGQKVKDWILTHPEPKRADPAFQAIPKAPRPALQDFLNDEEDEVSTDDEEYESEESDA